MKRDLFSRLLTSTALLVFTLPGFAADPPVASNELSEALQPFVEKSTLAGAVVLVADKKQVLAVETAGFADIANKVPMKPDTMFWIASQTKAITAAAVMILVDDGKVKLDDPINKYLPEFNNLWVVAEKGKEKLTLKRPARQVTIRDLLTHTSGMPFRSAAEEPTLDALPLRACIKTYAITPLETEPGTKYQYSNCGINTAGCIIEVVSGMPYETFLDKRLFGPLGMTDTTFWPSEAQTKRIAKVYMPNKTKDGLQETTTSYLQYPLSERTKRYSMPAGGLFSTAADVGKFCQMLLNGGKFNDKQVLSEQAVKEMSTKQTPESVKGSYGLGVTVGPSSFGHGGALSTNMTIDTKKGLVYVYLVQHNGFPGDGGKS